jgi:DNA-binding response OmpR family regulator
MAVVLCVDDEPTQLMLLRLALTRAGYEVLEAPDGQKGVDVALAHQPSLIIMGWMAPPPLGISNKTRPPGIFPSWFYPPTSKGIRRKEP